MQKTEVKGLAVLIKDNRELLEGLSITAVLAGLFLNLEAQNGFLGLALHQIQFFFFLLFTGVFLYTLFEIGKYTASIYEVSSFSSSTVAGLSTQILLILAAFPMLFLAILLGGSLISYLVTNFPEEVIFLSILFALLFPLAVSLLLLVWIDQVFPPKSIHNNPEEIFKEASSREKKLIRKMTIAIIFFIFLIPSYIYITNILGFEFSIPRLARSIIFW